MLLIIFNTINLKKGKSIAKFLVSFCLGLLTNFSNASTKNNSNLSRDYVFNEYFLRIANQQKTTTNSLPIPDRLIGNYYQSSPSECNDHNAGFELGLYINRFNIKYGAIESCTVKKLRRRKNYYSLNIRCNNEEAFTTENKIHVYKTSSGLVMNKVIYKKCANELVPRKWMP